MSTRKQDKAIHNLQQIWQLSKTNRKEQMQWLLRGLLVIGRQPRLSGAGFVLPTVAMVSLVVVLLTTSILIRSFDRSKNASTVRVNEAVLNAATPALDRARAKLDALLTDPTLPRQTPSDDALYNALTTNIKKYTLGDEKPLKLVFNFGNGQDAVSGSPPPQPNGTIESRAAGNANRLENDETLTTAWRFPVDTDNNGLYDSYTLYGIYFRSPTRHNTTGQFNRPRNPLEARTPPMDASAISGQCAAAVGTSASLVGDSGWYKAAGKLKKSFYVYTATVPITNTNPPTGYEKGNKGFSALEFQQDRARIPLSNNAVVYEDDIELSPGPPFRLNGRIVTNSNLLMGNFGNGVFLYQVSSPYSCYYEEENSKIVVGGNVAAGGIINGAPDSTNPVNVHLFQGAGNPPVQNQAINSTNKSTNNTPGRVSYNAQAYAQRIARLVAAQLANPSSTDPTDVQKKVNEVPSNQQAEERQKQLESYFRNRTRRVPSSEVPYGGNALGTYATNSPLQESGDTLRPVDAWMYPTNPSNGITDNGTGLTLNPNQLQATEPQQQKQLGKENYLGDRIQVGNNLPALWFNSGAFVGADTQQNISGATWTQGSGARYRQTRLQAFADLGITDRDGFWEQAAAAKPTTPLDNKGGLRVVTGAGVYERKNSFLPPPTYDNPTTAASEKLPTYDDPATPTVEAYPMVWPDSMPMSPGAGSQVFNLATGQWTPLPTLPLSLINSIPVTPTIDPTTPKYAKGDLRMRATAVYHYAQSTYDPNTATNYQTPIACVSSYYDPTDNVTARNPIPLPDVSGVVIGSQPTTGAKSNNGVTYGQPTTNASSLSGVSGSNATGLFSGNENSTTLLGRLYYQANLKFPNGRFVNEPLRNALNKKASNQNLTLSEQSAIDSTICALQILDGTLSPNTTFIPHGAIEENAFLDARQIKAIEQDVVDDPNTPAVNEGTNAVETFTTDGDANLTGSYNLSIEERQPLEIRATVLDMNALRTQTITGTNVLAPSEYLLPNSGIIYASRDDALPDLSDKSSPNIQTRKLLSPTDFELDPTRRPHSILLTNGSNLSRSQSFSAAEKGLILATNLPVYVNGDFNLHNAEEFTNTLTSTWSNFYNRTVNQINYNFACRAGDPRLPNCTTGDQWRPATVLGDAITLLSNNFRFGFRNDGDYDLRNNQGDRDSINKQLKNGFWNNNFVTSRNFQDSIYSGNTGNTNNDSSYFNNFVTPIQRRVNGFPEYIMEICRKLPVSECKPNDWVVGYNLNGNTNLDDPVTFDVNGDGIVNNNDTEKIIKANQLGKALASAVPVQTLNTARLGAGTTAIPALVAADQRYARRVAFARNRFNTLVFTDIGTGNNVKNAAKPLGVGCPLDATGTTPQNNGCQYPGSSTWTAGTHYGNPANNALWFRTTNNITGEPGVSANITYANNRPLYYLPPEQGGEKLVSPPTPEIPGVPSLNLPASNPASSYTICTKNDGATTNYSNSSNTTFGLNCNTGNSPANNAFLAAEAALNGFIALNPDASTTDNIVRPTLTGIAGALTNGAFNPAAAVGTITTFTNNPPASPQAGYIVNVININGDFAVNNNDTIIKLVGDENSIFVLRSSGSSLDFGSSSGCNTCRGVQLVLDGVDPNNVFWAVNSNMKWNDVAPAFPHKIAGTILNKGTGSPKWNNLIVDGGRILGVNGKPSNSNFSSDTRIYAIASTGQPLLVPVLQIQSTNGSPPTDPNAGGTAEVENTRWMMPATATTFNLVTAAADTPSRVNYSTSVFESNGGLYNFVRFLENWKNQITARISGSFIQLKRSAYATAPWSSVFSPNPGGIFNYRQAYRDAYGLLGNGWGYLPHYVAPDRQWGFDVALLSQPPDLFSERLTLPPTSSPSEFFREIRRDDPWIHTLLCAAVGQESPPNSGNYTYTNNAAVDDRQSLGCPQQLINY